MSADGMRSVPDADDVVVRVSCDGPTGDPESFEVVVRRVAADPEWLTCQSAAPGRATNYVPLSVRPA